MQSSFQDEMSFRVVRGVISICFHPLLFGDRSLRENELLCAAAADSCRKGRNIKNLEGPLFAS